MGSTSPIFQHDGTRWRHRDGRTILPGTNPDPPDPTEARFAGHIPNRVLIGMNAPADKPSSLTLPRPQYTESESFMTGAKGGYVRREFTANWYTNARLDAMLEGAHNHTPFEQFPVTSFKVDGNDWQGVIDGTYDATLTTWRNYVKTKRTPANGGTGDGKPFACGVHHEPSGDGSFAVWGQMQLYLCRWFTGMATGTYVPADDVSDIMPWMTIMNGFKWGPRQYNQADINAAYPPALIAAMRGKGIMMADFYDPEHQSFTRDAQGNRQENLIVWKNSNPDRVYLQLQGFVDWARANNVSAIGAGEIGYMTPAAAFLAWDVLRANRDIFAIGMQFNNFTNSRWDWRLLPANYPALNGTNSKGLVDVGGDTMSAAYLAAWDQITADSITPANTSPI